MPRSSIAAAVVIALGLCASTVARGQNATITATATVQPRPLRLAGISRSVPSGTLLVTVDGCAGGELQLDAHDTRTGTRTRVARTVITPSVGCMQQTVSIALPREDLAATPNELHLALVQSGAVLAPSVSQVLIRRDDLGQRARATVAY
jgi:hypothetical protein